MLIPASHKSNFAHPLTTGRSEKRTFSRCSFIATKTAIILPRQARDKHSESTRKKGHALLHRESLDEMPEAVEVFMEAGDVLLFTVRFAAAQSVVGSAF